MSDWNWPDIGRTAVEVAILTMILYAFIRFLQETRGSAVLKGFILVVAIVVVGFVTLVQALRLQHLQWIADRGLYLFLFGLLLVFQPELRQALVSLGESPLVRGFSRRVRATVTEEIVNAVEKLARMGLGALIVVERSDGIGGFAEGAVRLDAVLSSPLLVTIFFKDNPLHDGAAIIRGDRIVAAGCLLPLSESPNLSQALGTRHRAALGAAEECDALVIIVSEETRRISLAQSGKLEIGVTPQRLREVLELPAPEADDVPAASAAP